MILSSNPVDISKDGTTILSNGLSFLKKGDIVKVDSWISEQKGYWRITEITSSSITIKDVAWWRMWLFRLRRFFRVATDWIKK